MSLTLPKALLVGTCGLFLLMGICQALLLWWFQQQLQQQLSEQSQALSRIILARTSQKIELRAERLSVTASKTPSAPTDTTDNTAASNAATNQTASAPKHATMVIVSPAAPSPVQPNTFPVQLQQQLEQTLAELDGQAGQAGWVRQFKLENAGSAAQLTARYLRYQLVALAASVLVMLLLMLWFAGRLLQPVQRVQQGFRALASGQAGIQLNTAAPLQEYRDLLQQFNQTSQELAALQAQKAELARQQQLVELGEISRGLVHAMRNPLHTMALALEQIPDTAPALKTLIEQKMQHLNRTLTSLLTLSCAGIDRRQQISLKTVLQDLSLEFYHAAITFDPITELRLSGAESELRFILHVLLSNATEASPIPGSVRVSLQQQGQQVVLQVRDQGPGLPDAVAAALFAPHVSSKADGAGMGLYLARRLLQLYYHAEIQLQNDPAGGCVATLWFPLDSPALEG